MKAIKNIINIILNIMILSSMVIGVWAFVSTPTASDIEIRETANTIEQMEVKSIKNTDPATWEVVWVSEDYTQCYMNINGDIHVFTIFEAYDDIIVIEDFTGNFQEYYYTTK